jgi:hypothetical protein
MKPAEEIEKFVKKMSFKAGPEMDKDLWAETSKAQNEFHKKILAPSQQNIRRTIMKSPIVKLAAAAVIIALVVLGLFEFIGTESTSGVVWAEVAHRVEVSRGVIYRSRGTSDKDADQAESGYTLVYLSATKSRSDGFQNGRPWMTMYGNRETGKGVVLLHDDKGYVLENKTPADEDNPKHADHHDPKWWTREFMAHPHTKLEPTEIEGTLCEGIESSDATLMGDVPYRVDSFCARLWVSVETGYPVQFEFEFTGEYSFHEINDQFQWDVEMDPSIFEPNIPPDYEQM